MKKEIKKIRESLPMDEYYHLPRYDNNGNIIKIHVYGKRVTGDPGVDNHVDHIMKIDGFFVTSRHELIAKIVKLNFVKNAKGDFEKENLSLNHFIKE